MNIQNRVFSVTQTSDAHVYTTFMFWQQEKMCITQKILQHILTSNMSASEVFLTKTSSSEGMKLCWFSIFCLKYFSKMFSTNLNVDLYNPFVKLLDCTFICVLSFSSFCFVLMHTSLQQTFLFCKEALRKI